ncbi:tetratricopeptide (TPR) repeat protein [Pseudomonas sp. BIGb0450]|uniref:SIR2 family protein n=1 Tax=unclassified Pseudomonas TaxID=196821 RepID=UPI0021681303|nr:MULTISPECIES: SIR2 family protein [unclassified Pseudomonas]MCS3418508.1 tetratricopeptide (TPR) repeat protein [Pseudomonas sp. BIGb0558]MCS3437874.1 tetratricopeptide (TPR) repeat protein [Pseudomonas sp. BIGb0450]
MEIPFDIKEAIKNEKLVIFVGSGLSRSVGHPTWVDLLKNMLKDKKDQIENASTYSDILEKNLFGPLDILENLKENYKKIVYEYFEKTLSKTQESPIHKKLSTLSKKIVTTNYDKIIESNSQDQVIIDNTSNYNLAKLDTLDNYILKIHGDISRPDSCIIFKSDYENLYKQDTLAKYQLGKIFSNFTCLFLGFSFTDPYVTTLFNRISQLYTGYGTTHYLLTTNQTAYDGIKVIKIDNHSEINTYIELLNEYKNSVTKIKSKPIQAPIAPPNQEEFLLKGEGTDTPPKVEYWVGRERELKSLTSESNFKVIFITGFGGQGKSSLAAYYSETCKENNIYEITDWRDFKEEEHNFNLKISGLIEKISDKKIPTNTLVGLETDSLINIFFKELGNRSCLFVFDNVDSYIDLEKFEPAGSIGKLFTAALQTPHNAKFIFTCRPFIHYAGVNFFQLKLSGLTLEDVISLFASSEISISPVILSELAIRAHKLTSGHALWVSLILAQAKRGQRNIEDFLNNIEKKNIVSSSESAILSKQILREIWDSLNEKQKTLLRALAESITSESESEISKVVSSVLNFNQFSKALRTLKDLHLIVIKGTENYIELHPLVKEFIKSNFPSQEQKKFISLFIRYYDQFIILLKPRLNQILSLEEFKSWSNKIELHINNGEFNEAIACLIEIHKSINRSGYTEEYVRLSCALLDKITWKKNATDQLVSFLDFFNHAFTAITEYGDNIKSTDFLQKFENTTTSKNNEYIFILSSKTHLHWFNENYDQAIKHGEQADYLISQMGEQDKWDARHRLNLAYRDSEAENNVNKALDFFLDGYPIEEIASKTALNRELSYSIYGNAGRCLHLIFRYDEALNCYAKALELINDGVYSDVNLNQGYGFSWIGETLSELGSNESLYFYLYAYESWKKCAPPLANKILKKIDELPKTEAYKTIRALEKWEIEKYCDNWYKKRISNTNN